MSTQRGFTLVEAMVALLISGIVVASAVTTYRVGLAQSADQRREWNAFTIAQTQMEILSATNTTSTVLADNAADAVAPAQFGTAADANCTNGVDGRKSASGEVDQLGNPLAGEPYVLCWKVTPGSPSGTLVNLRVVSGFLDDFGTWQYLILQNIIGGRS